MSKLGDLAVEEDRTSASEIYHEEQGVYHNQSHNLYENCNGNSLSSENLGEVTFCAKEVDQVFQMPMNCI